MAWKEHLMRVNGGRKWIVVQKIYNGCYRIVANNITVEDGHKRDDAISLGMKIGRDSAIDLDTGENASDSAKFLGISLYLQVDTVKFDFRGKNLEIRASSLAMVRGALNAVKFEAYCPGNL